MKTEPANHSPSSSSGTAATGIGNVLRWNQHPVIATVLWMLGTDLENSNGSQNGSVKGTSSPAHELHPSSMTHSTSSGKLNVLWKDEHGGNINEYFNQIQPATPNANPNVSSSSSTTTSAPSSSSASSKSGSQIPRSQSTLEEALSLSSMSISQSQSRSNDKESDNSNSNRNNAAAVVLLPREYPPPSSFYYDDPEDHEGGNYYDNNPGDDIYQSPQWGFYVPITPPQQEMFAAGHSTSLTSSGIGSTQVCSSIQDDKRKKK
jgi:hypothetical protein